MKENESTLGGLVNIESSDKLIVSLFETCSNDLYFLYNKEITKFKRTIVPIKTKSTCNLVIQ